MRFLALTDLHGDLPEIDLDDHEYDVILLNGDYGFDEDQRYGVREYDGDRQDELIDEAVGQADRMLQEIEDRPEPTYMVPGNWDLQHYEIFHQFRDMEDIDRDRVEHEDTGITGYGAFENPTRPELPLYQDEMDEYPDREKREAEFFEHRDDLLDALGDAETEIILAHNSPQGSGLDAIRTEDGERYIGSIALRDVIDDRQPEYVISGHVHEAPGQVEIDQTTVVNPGYRGAVILDTEDDEIEWLTEAPDH